MTDRSTPALRPVVYRRSLAVLAAIVAMAGCAAPAAQESQLPLESAAATPSVRASASELPTLASPTPTATADPTATPAPWLAFEVPDDVLPPNSLAVVQVDALHIREGAGLDARILRTAATGEVVYVSGLRGRVVVDGIDWYQVQFISGWDGWPAYPPGTQNSWFGWAAAGSGADRYLELMPPDCPADDPDLATLALMKGWDRLEYPVAP